MTEIERYSDRYPTYLSCVTDVLSASPQPLSVDALIAQVAAQRPVTKGGRNAIYRAIGQLFQAVPVAPQQYGWLSSLLTGNVFRHPLTNDESRRGFMLLDELEHLVFFPQFFQNYEPDARTLKIELLGGPIIEAEAAVERNTWSLKLGKPFVEWIDMAGGQGRDDVWITVQDAAAGEYLLRLQPREIRDEDRIRDRNIQLAMSSEDLVSNECGPGEPMPTAEMAARLVGQGYFKETPPPDDLHYVLHQYSLLRFQEGQGYMLEEQHFEEEGGKPRGEPDNEDDDEGEELSPREFRERYADAVYSRYKTGRGGPLSAMVDEEINTQENDSEVIDEPAEGSCIDYEGYLESFQQADDEGDPLSHDDYHLLEAELESLVSLELEFGYLLEEQQVRKDELAERLFIDPESFMDNDPDGDYPDFDDSPFWQN